jgi:hypothetical protein
MIVRESIADVLKPKAEEDIYNEIDPVIDDFLSKVTFENVDETFQKYADAPWHKSRKLIDKNGNVTFLSSKSDLIDVIDDLAFSLSTGLDPETGDYYYKYKDFGDFWTAANTMEKDKGWKVIDRIIEKFANKFDIEY